MKNTNYNIFVENGKIGIYVPATSQKIPAVYDTIKVETVEMQGYFVLRLIVSQNGKYGVITIDNKVLIPVTYDRLNYLPIRIENNVVEYFYASKDCKRGLLDYKGQPVLPLQYDGLKRIKSKKAGWISFQVKKGDKESKIAIKPDTTDWVACWVA